MSATSATTAATRLTTDSAASESRPTEPVSAHAPVFSVIVVIAAAIDNQANFVRELRSVVAAAGVDDTTTIVATPRPVRHRVPPIGHRSTMMIPPPPHPSARARATAAHTAANVPDTSAGADQHR